MPKSTRWMPGTQGISYTHPHGARRRPYGQACVENGGHEKCANKKKLSGKEKNEDMEKIPPLKVWKNYVAWCGVVCGPLGLG